MFPILSSIQAQLRVVGVCLRKLLETECLSIVLCVWRMLLLRWCSINNSQEGTIHLHTRTTEKIKKINSSPYLLRFYHKTIHLFEIIVVIKQITPKTSVLQLLWNILKTLNKNCVFGTYILYITVYYWVTDIQGVSQWLYNTLGL